MSTEAGEVASRVAGLAQRGVDSMQVTRLDSHINTLHEMNGQLDRCCMHHYDLLAKLRGHMPNERGDNAKVAQADPPVMDALSSLDNEIMIKLQELQRMTEELRELI